MRIDEIAAGSAGGNVFKSPDGNSLTRRISLSEIDPTIRWLEKLTGLELYDNTLGSARKKKSSKDLDLAIDQHSTSKVQLISLLSRWTVKQPGNHADWIKKSGISVHFRTPIAGDPEKGFVQTDFMFTDDPRWMKFAMSSAGDQSRFSGADRNLIMSSIAKSLPDGLKYSWQKGLINRSTGELVSKDPRFIANVLLGPKHTESDLYSIETIASALNGDRKRSAALADLVVRLRSTDNKKPGAIKADSEEADRIETFLGLVA